MPVAVGRQVAFRNDNTVAVDRRTGEIVGGWAGGTTLEGHIVIVPPWHTGSVPLLIGTASSRPRLGYTVPPGEWGIQVTLRLGPDPRNSLQRRTPILPLTITA